MTTALRDMALVLGTGCLAAAASLILTAGLISWLDRRDTGRVRNKHRK